MLCLIRHCFRNAVELQLEKNKQKQTNKQTKNMVRKVSAIVVGDAELVSYLAEKTKGTLVVELLFIICSVM